MTSKLNPNAAAIAQREKQKREEEEETEKKTSKLSTQTEKRQSTVGSIGYLPDIHLGLALGLISGWKPPNARMARIGLKTDA